MRLRTGAFRGPFAAFAALLALVACGDRPASTPEPLPGPGPAGAGIAFPDGERLPVYAWSPRGQPKAVILALHGFGDSGALTYAGAAPFWAEQGIIVYAIDQRGFGAAPSRRAWPGAEQLESDAVTTARAVRARHPDLPLTVVGHSMGGGVALAAAGAGMPADGLVLAGPAIAGGDRINPAMRAGGWALARSAPDRRWTGEGIVEIWPTDNRDALQRVASDPRHFGDPSSRELYGLIRVMDRAAEAAPEVEIPTLTLMGAQDQILAPSDVQIVHDTIPGGAGFVVYPEGWHWLFRDLQAETVWRDVAVFALDPEGSQL